MSTTQPPTLRREIHPEVRIIDAEKGIVDYVASDETLDHYHEIVRARGWKFTHFQKNAPFVDSHCYDSIARLLGRVVDVSIVKGQLVERVQWAKDIPDTLAWWGWKMVEGGFLKAVSVGFYPTSFVSKYDADQSRFVAAVKELGIDIETAAKVRTIYLEQEQIELSACIIGANPNALAKAYKAGVLSDEDLDKLSLKIARATTEASATHPADVEASTRRARTAFLMDLQTKIHS